MTEFEKAINRAANLCSSSEKCSSDIRAKFLAWGLDEEEAEKGIEFLYVNKFLDDRRFAGYFVKDKLKFNKWGRIKIAYALRQKEISGEIIEQSMDEIDPIQYNEVLDHLLTSKVKSIGGIKTQANKAKAFRFAAQRGFTTDEIYKALERLKAR